MKKIPIFFIVVMTIMLLVVRCDDYDDSEVKADIAELQSRVSALESLCASLNSEISILQSTISAIQALKYVSAVSSVEEDGVTVGYTITFSDGSSIILTNGTDGSDATSGTTPVIGVSLIDGTYYWTLDGEVITDSDGNKIPAVGEDGSAGTTPQLKIGDDGYWYVSYDGGVTWIQLGEAYEDNGVSYITGVEQDDNNVYITLYDGTVLTLKKVSILDITFNLPTIGFESEGESIDVTYTITGADSETVVEALATEGYSASLSTSEISSGTITITAEEGFGDSEVMVIVSNSVKTILRVITIKSGDFIAATNSTVTTDNVTGYVYIPVSTNVEYTVSIPEEDDWLTYKSTKAMRTDTLVFTVTTNKGTEDRYTTVTLTSIDSTIVETILVVQSGVSPYVMEDWEIYYYGKYYYYSSGTYYDRIDCDVNNDEDEVLYAYTVFDADYVESVTIDSLFTLEQAYIDSMIEYYDGFYGSGYYLDYECGYTSDIYFYDIPEGEYYYAMMFAINRSGVLTGGYKSTERFTPSMVGGSDSYEAWIGTWNYTDAAGATGVMTISQKNADDTYNMILNGYETNYTDTELTFNSSDGSVGFIAYNTNTKEYSSSEWSYCTVYWLPFITYDDNIYYVNDCIGETIADGVLDDGGTTASVTGRTIESDYGATAVTYMGYVGILTKNGQGIEFSSPRTKLALPITLSYSSPLSEQESVSSTTTSQISFISMPVNK